MTRRESIGRLSVTFYFAAMMVWLTGCAHTVKTVAGAPHPSSSAPAVPLDGLIVTATMKQIIGSFSTYGHVRVGDTFELNLTNLPKDRIFFTRPNFDPQKATRPYVPFSSPLTVEKVEVGRKESVGSIIRLSSIATDGTRAKLIIQIWTPELRKGSKVWIKIYQEVFGDIGCMAEAEGFLNDNDWKTYETKSNIVAAGWFSVLLRFAG